MYGPISRGRLCWAIGFLALAIGAGCLSFAMAGPADIVSAGSGLTLGSGWYGRELFEGRPFHWVNNDAAIVIHDPSGPIKKIVVDVQGGPGLKDAQHFLLHLREGKRDIAVLPVSGSGNLRFDVPVASGHDSTVVLHVDGGGLKIRSDPRTLNFRVFKVDDASLDRGLGAGHPDVNGDDIKLGSNWYALEEFGGETFRWVDNDAKFTVSSLTSGRRRIEITAASGPAVSSPANWTLNLMDSSNRPVASAKVKARGTSYFDVNLNAGKTNFILHVISNGAKSPNDPRILSFRVFAIRLD